MVTINSSVLISSIILPDFIFVCCVFCWNGQTFHLRNLKATTEHWRLFSKSQPWNLNTKLGRMFWEGEKRTNGPKTGFPVLAGFWRIKTYVVLSQDSALQCWISNECFFFQSPQKVAHSVEISFAALTPVKETLDWRSLPNEALVSQSKTVLLAIVYCLTGVIKLRKVVAEKKCDDVC